MATIAEKSRTKEIIDRLQGILDSAPSVPLAAGKVTIYKDEVQSLLTELASQIEIELKTYHEVNDRKGKIISEAKKEAEKIIYQAERSASRMRVTKHTTGVAPLDYASLNDEERSALGNANEIYAASLIYTDEMLTEVTDMISDAYHNIRSDYEIILQVLEDKLNVINSNRAELMEGLQEMDPDDRSQQILEIGQLLSNELYTSRMKARMNPDEYEDGSVQLTLDLQEEQEEKTRQAEEKAQRAEAALAQMIAERDALAAKVEKLKNEGMKAAIQGAKSAVKEVAAAVEQEKEEKPSFVKMEAEPSVKDVEQDEEEYEVIYVTEDELEEGEEYEIEYVDEEEYEAYEKQLKKATQEEQEVVKDKEETVSEEIDKKKDEPTTIEESDEETEKSGESKDSIAEEKTADQDSDNKAEKGSADPKEVEEAIKELENLEKESEKIPLIPHFKKSQSVASVPAEQIAKMAKAITTEEKYSGLIGRAVKQREQQEVNDAVKMVEELPVSAKDEKKPDKKADSKGNEYVQATMKFDEDFEITEF